MNQSKIASYIDHTILKATATEKDIEQLCAEAVENQFASVCINPCYVPLALSCLKDSSVEVCTVIGFPLGANQTMVKAFEAKMAVEQGATEVDMVINIGYVKSGRMDLVEEDVITVVKTVKEVNPIVIVKVIIETCLLTEEEKESVVSMLLRTGADFVKTSTGFSTGGATKEDIQLMKRIVGDQMKIKASGEVRTYQDFLTMVEAGADRIGTSNGITIMQQ